MQEQGKKMTEIQPEPKAKETVASVETKKDCDATPSASSVNENTEISGASNVTYRSSLDTTPRKVVVHNVLKFLNKKDLDAMVQSWLDDAKKNDGFRLVIDRYRKPPRNGWVTVTVAEDCMVEPFIKLINGTKRVNKRGQIMVAKRAGEDSGNRKKRSRDGNDSTTDGKRARHDVPVCPTPSQIRSKLTALWAEPYQIQLETKKKDMIRNCAMKIEKEMKARFRTIEKEARRNPNKKEKPKQFAWINATPSIKVENVMNSPVITKYRNKCELTFGYRCPDESESGTVDKETQSEKNGEEIQDRERVHEKNIHSADESVPGKIGISSRIPTLGFLPYGWRHSVARPHCLQNIPDEVCAISDLIDDFLLSSPFAPYESGVHRGLWRSVTIRSSERTGEVMLIVVHASPEGAAGDEKPESDSEKSRKEKRDLFEKERDRLVAILTKSRLSIPKRDLPMVDIIKESDNAKDEKVTTGNEKSVEREDEVAKEETPVFSVTSIFFQEYNGLSNPSVSHPVQHIYGTKFITEKLGKNTYQISPGAFFQVTTAGAEILYDVVADRIREVSSDPLGTLMFDVCCGTGTIGLHCLTEGVVGRVVGVDISKPAIDDALANAIRNGFGDEKSKGKTRFVASRAELVMGDELRRANSTIGGANSPRSIVAVVDPARDGLHPNVIKAIRSTKEIQRLVYVSCNPTGSLVNDAAILCGHATNKYRGLPFKPTRAQPVDMFPLTPHCEMVMTFDRMTEEEVRGESESAANRLTGTCSNKQLEDKNEEVQEAEDTDPNI